MRAAVTTRLRTTACVIVDPNRMSRSHPELTAVGFEDADRAVEVGEIVLAVQPDDDGSAFVGLATVERIDTDHMLIYLLVDWSSFVEEEFYPAGQAVVGWEEREPCPLGDPANWTDVAGT